MKKQISRLFIISNLLVISVFITFPSYAENQGISTDTHSKKINADKEKFFDNGEEKVIISIINYGRKNPFKPYTEPKGIVLKKDKDAVNLDDIPPPPAFNGGSNGEIQDLMSSKVNGILYDPKAKSVAIVSIKGSEYMVHEGDSVQGITIKNIANNNVTLKYGSNTYTLAVGDVIKGNIQNDPVERKQKIFGGSDYNLPNLNLKGKLR